MRPAGPGRLAFAHALVRDALLAEVPELRRSRLHARLAAALPASADACERATTSCRGDRSPTPARR